MPKSFDLSFKHPDSAETFDVTVDLGSAPFDADALIDAIREAYPNARTEASRQYVVALLGPGGGEPNLGAIAIQADKMRVEEITFDGPTQRYSVGGIYSDDDGGDWLDWVDATDPVDAEFKAKWEMSCNEGADPDDFLSMLDNMSGIRITSCGVEPVTKDEYKATLLALVEEARAAGHAGPALDAAVEQLVSDGVEIEEAPGMRP